MYDRSLLSKLSLCAWKVLKVYLQQSVPYDDAVPGAVIAVQSFGDFQNFNPHLHVLAADGCFYGDGSFMVCTKPEAKDLEDLFRYEVFKMLRAEGKINEAIIENMLSWRHSGFNVYCGKAIWPHNEEGLENLARYIIRASFSQERMAYIPAYESNDGIAKVVYESKDGKTSKTLDALDWLAQLVTHIPNKSEQMVCYYGFYSNKSRGLRKKAGTDDEVPSLIESDASPGDFSKNWARLIKKIYNVDPLVCPKCHWKMRILSAIEQADVIEKILKHLGLWLPERLPPPKANGPPIIPEPSHIPSVDDYLIDPDYPIDSWMN